MRAFKVYMIAGVSLMLALASCRVGKPYSRKETGIPDTYRGQEVAVTADTILLPWNSFFKDPVLIELIGQALKRNNDVRVALMNVQQHELAFRQAKLGWLPALNFSAGAERTWLSKNSLNGSLSDQFLGTPYMDDYNATFRLSWEADIWGKNRMQKESARADYFAQQEQLSALKTRIIVQVAQAYYNLLTLDEQLKVARRNVSLGDSTLQMITLQYQSGMTSSVAVTQAAAQQKTAALLVPVARQQIAIQENALSILCGNYPDSIVRSGHLWGDTGVQLFATGVPATLLSRRPDVKAAEYAIVAANARAGLAKAAMYPSLSLTPSAGLNSFRFSSWFDLPGSVLKNVGANLTQPVFQKRALQTAHKIAILEQEKQATIFKQTVMVAVGEVSDALARIQYTAEALALAGDKTSLLLKATHDAGLLYRSGMASYLEVITTQNGALQQELETISLRRDQLYALTDLYRALGGGVEEQPNR